MICLMFITAVACSCKTAADDSSSRQSSDEGTTEGTTEESIAYATEDSTAHTAENTTAYTGENTTAYAETTVDTGKVRIPYTGSRSSITYVTSASDLPDYEELAAYDDAYFQDHALVLVIDTVNSGSVDVGILSVDVEASAATVTLYHRMPSDALGTTDMATWLLWIEVESGLDYQWTIANPSAGSDTVSY